MRSPIPLFLFVLVTAAHAQWRTTEYSLKPGWNSLYLNGDATYLTPDQHFANQPDVVEVWRWNPNPASVQFTSSPSDPTPGSPEWSVWRRGQPQYSDLALLTGQTSYLIKTRDSAPAVLVLPIKQRVEPPVLNWVRTGANLLGFPAKKNGATFPTFANYFATFSAATSSKIYRYQGGPLNANNPARLFAPTTDRLDATQAYWFEARTVGDFIGPLAITLSEPTGLNFGRQGSSITLTIRNRTAVTQTLTLDLLNSEAAPAGQTPVVGPVALTRRSFNTTNNQFEDTRISAPFTAPVAANATITLNFGVDRTAMVGGPGALYASLLRITDAANMMDVHLPVSAGNASLAGLWVGDAELTDVQSKVSGFPGTGTSRSFPLRYLIHVDDAGRATLLSAAYLGVLKGVDGAPGIATTETALQPESLGTARRLTAAHMPLDRTVLAAGGFGPGGSITGTINLPFNDPTNPFVHQYHPDHDNKDARFNPVGNGVESWTVNRAVTFSVASTPPAEFSASWGSRTLAGTYSETVTGVRKDPITATGTFVLRRVSELGTLTTTTP